MVKSIPSVVVGGDMVDDKVGWLMLVGDLYGMPPGLTSAALGLTSVSLKLTPVALVFDTSAVEGGGDALVYM